MNLNRIEAHWRELKGWVNARLGDGHAAAREECDNFPKGIRKRYGLTKHEAAQCAGKWVHEPGVLDDWNDRRPI